MPQKQPVPGVLDDGDQRVPIPKIMTVSSFGIILVTGFYLESINLKGESTRKRKWKDPLHKQKKPAITTIIALRESKVGKLKKKTH